MHLPGTKIITGFFFSVASCFGEPSTSIGHILLSFFTPKHSNVHISSLSLFFFFFLFVCISISSWFAKPCAGYRTERRICTACTFGDIPPPLCRSYFFRWCGKLILEPHLGAKRDDILRNSALKTDVICNKAPYCTDRLLTWSHLNGILLFHLNVLSFGLLHPVAVGHFVSLLVVVSKNNSTWDATLRW